MWLWVSSMRRWSRWSRRPVVSRPDLGVRAAAWRRRSWSVRSRARHPCAWSLAERVVALGPGLGGAARCIERMRRGEPGVLERSGWSAYRDGRWVSRRALGCWRRSTCRSLMAEHRAWGGRRSWMRRSRRLVLGVPRALQRGGQGEPAAGDVQRAGALPLEVDDVQGVDRAVTCDVTWPSAAPISLGAVHRRLVAFRPRRCSPSRSARPCGSLLREAYCLDRCRFRVEKSRACDGGGC